MFHTNLTLMVNLRKIAKIAFLIIILTLITPLLLTSDLWDASWKKLSIIFFSLFIGASEIWVNTINSQFYLGLFSCFLLLSDTENLKSWRTCYVLFMVFNAALTGITSVILLPFYFIQYLRKIKTSSLDKIILIILTLGLTIQILALLHLSSNSSISRFNLNNMINFPNRVYQNLTSIIPVSGNLFRIGFLSIFISALIVKKNDFKIILPAIIAIYVSMTFAFLALSMSGGGRYGYMPAVLCFIFLLNLYPTQNRTLRTFYIIIISALLCVSFLKFFKTRDVYDQSWIPYSLKNGYLNTEGSIEVKIFPQWNNTNWSIKIPNDKYKSN